MQKCSMKCTTILDFTVQSGFQWAKWTSQDVPWAVIMLWFFRRVLNDRQTVRDYTPLKRWKEPGKMRLFDSPVTLQYVRCHLLSAVYMSYRPVWRWQQDASFALGLLLNCRIGYTIWQLSEFLEWNLREPSNRTAFIQNRQWIMLLVNFTSDC